MDGRLIPQALLMMMMMMTMTIMMMMTMMNIYISWKVDSPSTAITKGSLGAVLVQCYPASAPVMVLIIILMIMISKALIRKSSSGAMLVQCHSSSAPDDNHDDQYDLNDDLDNYNHDNDKKKLFGSCTGPVLLFLRP